VSAVLAVALAALALLAPPRPAIVWKPIPFGPARLAEMTAYARRHYGIESHVLHPRAIVEHVTATSSFSSAYNTFAADVPDGELHQLPGTCAHFIVDRDGTIYQLVRLDVMCRHTVGLNWAAIGIEHVGLSDAQVLGDAAQLRSSLALTVWLMAPWRCQTHADWQRPDMNVYRAKLVALARTYGLSTGPPPVPRATGC
jgi:beta-N-acetylhexosaminidase